jgi:DNA (cytosine-5)-methyltransferase 1
MIRVHDLFAGAGGSSTGIASLPGVQVILAANHWQLAVEVHNANHPDTDHLQADISQYDPRRLPGADILWASPECTNHSRAKGRKAIVDGRQPDLFGEILPDAAAERSRATMWDVFRFAEVHQYAAIIVENVVEVTGWVAFEPWVAAMHALGYEHQVVSLNSMHASAGGLPAPQSRDRVYVVFWRKGNRRPDFHKAQRPQAFCPKCELIVEAQQAWKNGRTIGRYRQQYVYVHAACGTTVEPAWLPAAAAIDWTLPGTRIGDRTKPLAAKTRKRIAAGIARYWGPMHLEAGGHTYDAADPKHKNFGDPNAYYRAWSSQEPLKTLHTIESKALAVPVEGREGKVAQPMGQPMRTMTTRAETAMAYPPLLTRHYGIKGGAAARHTTPVDEVMRTLTTSPGQSIVQPPFIAELRGGGSTARPVSDPAATFTASGNHHGLVTPYYGASSTARPTDDAIGTLTTRDRYGLVTPAGGSWNDDARPTDDALRSLTTREAYALVHRHNSGGAEMLTPADEPMRTLTTKGHQSLLTPGDLAAAESQVDDCLFRMLEPHEVAAGMAFPGDYLWSGTRRERVKLAGNAVTPPAARDLMAVVIESLDPTWNRNEAAA